MKTIIIPAHCRSAFINLFKLSSSLFPEDRIHCRFLQIKPVPDNYNDLLTLPRNASTSTPFDVTFMQTITELNKFYGTRISFDTDHIYGDSPAVFRNYAQHNHCDLVIYDKEEWQDSKQKNKLDIFRMVSRSGCELMYISGGNLLLQNKPATPSYNERAKQAPASILYQYNTVDERLNNAHENVHGKQIISKKLSNLSRYFLSEDLLQKMLLQSNSSLLLLKK